MPQTFSLLFIGDVIGPVGCAAVQAHAPALRSELGVAAIVANGENSAASGFGVTAQTGAALLSVVDFLTLGDHAFDQPEIGAFLDAEPRISRPANVATDRPGRSRGLFEVGGVHVGIVTVLGNVFMRMQPTSPFAAVDAEVQALRAAGAQVILVEIHAEATSEKQAMGWYCAGRVAAVLGTHTHTPTADLRVLPGGTGYVTDVGMTGGAESIIGFSREDFLRFLAGGERPQLPSPATGDARLDAIRLEIDLASGQAVAVERVSRTYPA
jgi:metallophosphoesterase (TIGR00282 family)